MWGWTIMCVFQWFSTVVMWSYCGTKPHFKGQGEKHLLETVLSNFIPLHFFVFILLINSLSQSVCLSACYSQSLFLSLPLFVSLSLFLSVLGRVFLPRPLMASLSASSVQAWLSPLKNTALSLVPPLATTQQVLGWWTSILRSHFHCVTLS